MATRLELINRALSELGELPLQRDPLVVDPTADDRSDSAIYIAQTYPGIVEGILSRTDWSWALTFQPLDSPQSFASFPDEFLRQFAPIPSGYTMWYRPDVVGTYRRVWETADRTRPPLRLGEEYYSRGQFAYVLEAYSTDVHGEFIQSSTPVSAYPLYFQDALVLSLAARWVYKFTERADLAATLPVRARDALREAQRYDAQHQPTQGFGDMPWNTVRWGRRTALHGSRVR